MRLWSPKVYPTGRAVTDELLPGRHGRGSAAPLRVGASGAARRVDLHAPGGPERGTAARSPARRRRPRPHGEYTLTATDKNDDEATLSFSIEVKPGIQSRDLGLVLAGVGRTLASDAVENPGRSLRLRPSLPASK